VGCEFYGRRIGKAIDEDGDSDVDFALSFVYDNDHIVLVFADPDGEGEAESSLANRYLHGPAIDQVLADEQVHWDAFEEDYVTDHLLWALGDHLNSVRDLAEFDAGDPEDADDDLTEVVNHIAYDSFGVVASESSPSFTHLFGFTGRPFSDAAELQNNLHRWYDAAVGVWLVPDPIGFTADDANLYRYAFNNSIRLNDPTGLDARIRHSGFHTGIDVEIWNPDGTFAGVLTIDNQAAGYAQQQDTSCDCCGSGLGRGSKMVFRDTGEVWVGLEPAGRGRLKGRSDRADNYRLISGTIAQDEALVRRLLMILGKSRTWLNSELAKGGNVTVQPTGEYAIYSALFVNCNHFTADMVATYVAAGNVNESRNVVETDLGATGYSDFLGWGLTGSRLVSRWDYYFGAEGSRIRQSDTKSRTDKYADNSGWGAGQYYDDDAAVSKSCAQRYLSGAF
jgi:RHS repeat-associated protein